MLLTPVEVAVMLRVRDRRTVRRRLAELAVPTVPFGRSYRVRDVDLERAVAGAVTVAVSPADRPRTMLALPKGARLWDDEPAIQKRGRAA